jgi:NuA3 HAT complex component NTO1
LDKLRKTFYTTTMPLARELSVIFTAGIVNEPPLQLDLDVHSSPKKQGVDIKERRKLAKRIIKAIQPQFEAALRAEADISGIDFDKELKKLEHLWETCLEAEPSPHKDSEGDMAMDGEVHGNHNGHTNGDNAQSGEDDDVDMEDIDAPYDEDDIVVDVSTGHLAAIEDDGDTITTAALSEVNGNKPPSKVNGVKGADTNGHASGTENGQDDTSISLEPIISDNPPIDNTLTEGGVPQFLQGFFNIDGTNISEIVQEEPEGSDELSEMDDEQVNQLVAHKEKVTPILPPTPTTTRSKKAKNRRRR